MQAAQAARELAQKKLEAEQSKFEVGMSTNYFVVQAQRDLADAQNTELRADPELPQVARRARAPAADDAAEPEHHAISGGAAGKHDATARGRGVHEHS